MNVIHNGVNIEYNETDNTWEFTLRGRERKAYSLAQARGTIDKPVSEKTEKTFVPVKGWFIESYGSKVQEATATSIAASRYGSQRVRLTIQGKSTVENLRCFFPLNEKNAKKVDELRQLQTQIEALQAQRVKTRESLEGLQD